ncbi:hypothetical protein EBZ35_08585, partial [bacterium]|nr:hypothetical protein [bacterium]
GDGGGVAIAARWQVVLTTSIFDGEQQEAMVVEVAGISKDERRGVETKRNPSPEMAMNEDR